MTDSVVPSQRTLSASRSVADEVEAQAPSVLPELTPLAGRTFDRVPAALLVSDLLALLVACTVAPLPLPVAALLGIATVGALNSQSLYTSRLTLSVVDELPMIVGALLAAVGVTALVLGLGIDTQAALVTPAAWLVAFAVGGRTVTYAAIRAARSRGWVQYRALVMGSGTTAARVARVLDEHPEHGLRVAGFIGSPEEAHEDVLARIVEKDLRETSSATVRHGATVVIVALGELGTDEVLAALRDRDQTHPCTLFVVPPLYQVLHSPRVERVHDVALIRLRTSLLEVLPWRVKRLFDVAVALAGLLVAAPFMAVAALAVRIETGPKVLFEQTRVGRNDRPFTLYKFRSLRPATAEESAQQWSVSQDHRIGPVGRFIRKTSIDELPQLYNILKGDMSLVGPRPERPHFVQIFEEQYLSYSQRHRVRPGLTGWAAVHGLRGDTSIEDRCFLDNVYIDSWSLWLDIKILLRTASAVLGGRGS